MSEVCLLPRPSYSRGRAYKAQSQHKHFMKNRFSKSVRNTVAKIPEARAKAFSQRTAVRLTLHLLYLTYIIHISYVLYITYIFYTVFYTIFSRSTSTSTPSSSLSPSSSSPSSSSSLSWSSPTSVSPTLSTPPTHFPSTSSIWHALCTIHTLPTSSSTSLHPLHHPHQLHLLHHLPYMIMIIITITTTIITTIYLTYTIYITYTIFFHQRLVCPWATLCGDGACRMGKHVVWWNAKLLCPQQPSAEIVHFERPNIVVECEFLLGTGNPLQRSRRSDIQTCGKMQIWWSPAQPLRTKWWSTVKNWCKIVILKVQMQAWHESQTAITVGKLRFFNVRCQRSRIGVKLRLYPFWNVRHNRFARNKTCVKLRFYKGVFKVSARIRL